LFSRSGQAVVPATKSNIVVSGVPLTSASIVFALVQQNQGGVYVRAAVPNPSASSFTVLLNKATPSNATVGWFIVN
jgi:hypothetical protein